MICSKSACRIDVHVVGSGRDAKLNFEKGKYIFEQSKLSCITIYLFSLTSSDCLFFNVFGWRLGWVREQSNLL